MSPEVGRFRAEVRGWLRAHVPAGPLPSVDTAEGFARHRAWERELAAARLSVVSWPPEYGGRGASLLEWLVFEVADAWIGAQAYRLHTFATVGRLAAGGTLGAEASMGKVFWSELDVALHETALELLGPRAEQRGGEDGRWLDGYLFSLGGPIYAGTNEIQRTVIAERLLGLPR